MHTVLTVFSALSILLLVLILPGQIKSHSIPAVTVLCWLFLCSNIHLANSLIWANSTEVQAAVWCDISTKVLLGAMVAVPGAFFCTSRQLEVLTSTFDHTKMPSLRRKLLVEVLMCIAVPILYISLHTIVQFRRFSILQDFGCQAAVHDSLPSLMLVWLPPFVISACALLYSVSAVFNVAKSHYNSSTYFPSAPEMSLSLFTRRLAFCTLGMAYTAAVYATALSWESSNTLPLTSVAQVHADFSHIEIIPADSQLSLQSQLIWWNVPIWSILLCVMSAFGEETRKGYRSLWKAMANPRSEKTLPVHAQRPTITIPRTSTSQKYLSPWDATIKSNKTLKLKGSQALSAITSPVSAISSASDDKDDESLSFTHSTLNYLETNAARQLSLASPPSVTVSHYKRFTTPEPPVPVEDILPLPVRPPRPDDTMTLPGSRTSSILSASAWPQPPPSPPMMHPYAYSAAHIPSPTPMGVRATSPIPGDSPFAALAAPAPVAVSTLPSARRKPSLRSLKSKARVDSPFQMSVLQETVVHDV
ncbi:unnamed protein product [Peniophora sp. CBMAI 1063]|nr:unnamed protein product [Peniophora sp. CBMAI 1063]